MERDSRVDDYIARAAPFAQPILTRLRELAHAALPDATEAIKWGMPHLLVEGKNVAGLAAFKAHCALVIHGSSQAGAGMGGYAKIASFDQIPPEAEIAGAANVVTGPAPVILTPSRNCKFMAFGG